MMVQIDLIEFLKVELILVFVFCINLMFKYKAFASVVNQ